MREIRFKREKENIEVDDYSPVTVKECGNVTQITYSSHRNSKANIIKVSKDYYILPKEGTGELHEFNHVETRLDDTLSVKESLERLRDYLNTNITDVSHCRWITLTYKENMTDTERLYSNFKRFNRKCRKKYGEYEYIKSRQNGGNSQRFYRVFRAYFLLNFYG